jgi:hypothetical protein
MVFFLDMRYMEIFHGYFIDPAFELSVFALGLAKLV